MRSRNYTTEFKSEAVKLIFDQGRSIRQVAEDLGLSHWTVRNWYRESRMVRKSTKKPPVDSKAISEPESDKAKLAQLERENAALRKEVASLRMDREILKKAAAFFAKESE